MMRNIKVVAFDIDGTLYPQLRFFSKIFFHFWKNVVVFYHFGRVRKALRRCAPLPDLFRYQAILLSERMKCTTLEAEEKLNRVIYDTFPRFFKKVKCYKNVKETFIKLKEAGYKIAILSDFPPEQKGDMWGVLPYCDGVFSAEKIGALKPSKYSFGIMAREMGVKMEEILYVGNSKKYDVEGAKNAGMKTAYLMPLWRRIFNRPLEEADISFKNYRQFMNIVLK
ncbi:MAG: HAD family hydrolase [Treponema sp.]|uniref:HAD family hydrolase n=1 Tax=Treponema sp. TaxID=166 RepID=UPI00298E4D5B|nr:HAD family hydrolase [Treponema sp.]MBR5933703.1 HAD family hydrolase [Treponema sp.]